MMIEVFSSGGGTQSSAISALIIQGKLPKPDFACIADTGFEKSETWDYLEKYVAPGLSSVGVQIHRISKDGYAYAHDGVFNKAGTLLIPAFSNIDGGKSKLPNFCTKYWKIDVVDNWLSREHGIKRAQYRKWIGFSIDEANRAHRMMAGAEYKAGLIRLPLIHDIPQRRRHSIDVVKSMGWPEPPRSNCSICPNQSDGEWRLLKQNHPDEFAAAVALEKEMQKRDPHAWLHKSCRPLDEVDFSDAGLFSRPCDSGQCFL